MKWLGNFLIIFFLFCLQVALKNYFGMGEFVPIFNLIGVILAILFFDFKDALIFSFISGLFLDIFSSFFGFHLLFFFFLVLIISFLKKEWLHIEGVLGATFLVLVSVVFYYFILFIFLKRHFHSIMIDYYFFKALFFGLIFNGVFATFLYYPFLKWKNFISILEQRKKII